MQSELDQHVVELFHSTIDVTMQSLDSLAPAISDCGALLAQCLLSEKKIVCCGDGQQGALAQIFASNLVNRFDYERPSLPAIALNVDATTITAIAADGSFNEIYAKQIRALGQSGDVLLVISSGSSSSTTRQAIQAAHDREMIVISVGDESSHDISAIIFPEDMEINIASTNRARVVEGQLIVINYLCELIDKQLFGSED
ncbi:MAG: D-sedoheptulose 7-phosphate isomerase [Gammaproteobacteria bacterium]|jgi:D-sedoheptulose 7-phosphate isomerase